MELFEQLSAFGIKKDAASVYFALLELGEASILDVSRHTGIKRSTVYDLARNLQQMGLVSEEFSGHKRRLTATDPEQLVGRAQGATQALQQALPALQALRGDATAAPHVLYFEGIKGIKAVYEQVLLQRQDYDVIGSNKYFFEQDESYFKEFVSQRRPTAGIHTRLLLERDASAAWQKSEEASQLTSVRFLPKDYPVSESIMILPDRLVLDTQSAKAKAVAVVIKHPGLVGTFQQLFRFMWANAEQK